MESKTPVKDRLTKKIKKRDSPHKNDSRGTEEDNGIFEMLGKVSEILKQNPEMLTKVNKCVSNIIDNKDLMDKLSTQIKENIQLNDSSDPDPEIDLTPGNISAFSELIKDDITQALDKSELGDSLDAVSNESTQ